MIQGDIPQRYIMLDNPQNALYNSAINSDELDFQLKPF